MDRATNGGSLLRQPLFWTSLALPVAIAVGIGTQRAPSGPPWWVLVAQRSSGGVEP